MFNKIKLSVPVYKIPLLEHKQIKLDLLALIDKTKHYQSLSPKDSDNITTITSLDWNDSNNFDREWVNFFLPYWKDAVGKIKNHMDFKDIYLSNMWFQRYQKGDQHGWHIHASHYTGVYYLDFDKDSPKTEIVDPFSKRIKKIRANEGDIVIFPSTFLHRSPINKSNQAKTIISWNFDIVYD